MDNRRDRAEWIDYLLRLPDAAFLNIIKNYLGRIETPYHKPRLIEKLEKYLSETSTCEAITELISEEDRQILSLIALRETPSIQDMLSFLEQEGMEDADIKIKQLCDRLLIFTDKEEKIQFCPVIKTTVIDRVISISDAFPAKGSADKKDSPITWCSPALVAAFFSMLVKEPSIITASGDIKTKKKEEIMDKIAALRETPDRQKAMIKACERLGILKEKDKTSILKKAQQLAELTHTQLIALFAAASAVEDSQPYEHIQDLAGKILTISRILLQEKSYPEATIDRAIRFAAGNQQENNTDSIKQSLILWGILHKKGSDYIRGMTEYKKEESPAMTIEQTGRINIFPHAELSDILIPACAAELEKHDIVSHYTINKKSYTNLIESGIEPEELSLHLILASKKALPHTLAKNLELWQEESLKVRHIQGTVAILQKEHAKLIKQLPEYRQCIREELAENIFIISNKRLQDWKDLLNKTGIEIIPPVEREDMQQDTKLKISIKNPAIRINAQTRQTETPARRQKLMQILEKKDLPEETRKNLAAKIEAGFILFPGQITEENSPQDIMEAGGLDYQAKLRLIEEALRRGTEKLEIETQSITGTINIKARPLKLTKEGTRHILLAQAPSSPHPLNIEVAKIKKVKRLPQTLS